MADSQSDWRVSLTASERYDNIQRLTKSITATGLSQSAFSLENEAYKNCNSREEYNAAVSLSFDPPEPITLTTEDEPSYLPFSNQDFPGTDDDSADPGIRIGSYQNCHYIASGITAEVYRSHPKNQDRNQAIALKVIVETHNIEPHNPAREAKMLEIFSKDQQGSSRNLIPLLETFRDQNQRFVLVFPYLPLTLGHLLEKGPHPLSNSQIQPIFLGLFRALSYLQTQGIIHRDVKPSAILLSSSSPTTESEIYLSDFGTAWHPILSLHPPSEPHSQKILDIGTGPYRAPEVLFGNKSYSTAIDMWASGVMLSECCSPSGKPIFESRPVHEDGNQLGLILSIFKTIGSPTRESWPEAGRFRTPPFETYRCFEGKKWEEILEGVEGRWKRMVERLVRYESRERATAREIVEELEGKGKGDWD